MNKVFLVGRFASEPQQFVTANGITQSRVNIAVSDNHNRNETYFLPCVAWGSTANFMNTYLSKGTLVSVDGKIVRREYINKQGNKTYITEIVIENLRPLSSSKKENKVPAAEDYVPEELNQEPQGFNSQPQSNQQIDDSQQEEDIVDLDWMELNQKPDDGKGA